MKILSVKCDNFTRTVTGTFNGIFSLSDATHFVRDKFTHVGQLMLVYFLNETDTNDGEFKFTY